MNSSEQKIILLKIYYEWTTNLIKLDVIVEIRHNEKQIKIWTQCRVRADAKRYHYTHSKIEYGYPFCLQGESIALHAPGIIGLT